MTCVCSNMCTIFFLRYAEEQIGQGQLKFACLNSECKEEFSLNVLKGVLKSSVFSNLLKRKQAEEIFAAGIDDLESCPFCNFATVMPNKEDKVSFSYIKLLKLLVKFGEHLLIIFSIVYIRICQKHSGAIDQTIS